MGPVPEVGWVVTSLAMEEACFRVLLSCMQYLLTNASYPAIKPTLCTPQQLPALLNNGLIKSWTDGYSVQYLLSGTSVVHTVLWTWSSVLIYHTIRRHISYTFVTFISTFYHNFFHGFFNGKSTRTRTLRWE